MWVFDAAAEIDASVVGAVAPIAADGSYGDGIALISVTAGGAITLRNSIIDGAARAGSLRSVATSTWAAAG